MFRFAKLTKSVSISGVRTYKAYDETGALIDTLKGTRDYHAIIYWNWETGVSRFPKHMRNSYGRPDLLARELAKNATSNGLVCVLEGEAAPAPQQPAPAPVPAAAPAAAKGRTDYLTGAPLPIWKSLGDIEKHIARTVVESALQAGFLVSVDNGGDEDEIEKSSDLTAILAVMFATSDERVYFYDPTDDSGNYFGWAMFVYGNEGYNVLADNTTNCEAFLGAADALASRYEAVL